jgi:hypothetical protein
MNPVRPIWFHADVLFKEIDGETERMLRVVLKGGLTG